MNIVNYGLYTVKDEYFNTYKSKYFSDNKSENRPYYLSFTDRDGIIWLIPVSTQIISYGKKIADDVNRHGMCIFYHVGKIYGADRVFQIGNMFPITANYLKKEYTYSGIHYIIGDKNLIKEISKRAKKFLALVQHGKLKPNVDIMAIKKDLLKNNPKYNGKDPNSL